MKSETKEIRQLEEAYKIIDEMSEDNKLVNESMKSFIKRLDRIIAKLEEDRSTEAERVKAGKQHYKDKSTKETMLRQANEILKEIQRAVDDLEYAPLKNSPLASRVRWLADLIEDPIETGLEFRELLHRRITGEHK